MWNICIKAGQPTILLADGETLPDGYTIDGQTSNPNYLTDSTPQSSGTRITNLAFRNRFTMSEKIYIELASIDNPAATLSARQLAASLRVYLRDLDNAKWIDLTRQDTIDDVNLLVYFGLVTSARAAAILDASTVQEIEVYVIGQ